MSDDALKILGLVCALVGGFSVGSLVDGAIWRADCESIGAHQSSDKVYDCKLRKGTK